MYRIVHWGGNGVFIRDNGEGLHKGDSLIQVLKSEIPSEQFLQSSKSCSISELSYAMSIEWMEVLGG